MGNFSFMVTSELKNRISEELSSIDSQIHALSVEVESSNLDVHQKEEIFSQIDKLEKDRDEELEKVLMKILLTEAWILPSFQQGAVSVRSLPQ